MYMVNDITRERGTLGASVHLLTHQSFHKAAAVGALRLPPLLTLLGILPAYHGHGRHRDGKQVTPLIQLNDATARSAPRCVLYVVSEAAHLSKPSMATLRLSVSPTPAMELRVPLTTPLMRLLVPLRRPRAKACMWHGTRSAWGLEGLGCSSSEASPWGSARVR